MRRPTYTSVYALCARASMCQLRDEIKRGREKTRRDKTGGTDGAVPREIMTVCITVHRPSSGITIVSTHKTVGRIHARLTAHAHARPPIHASVNCSWRARHPHAHTHRDTNIPMRAVACTVVRKLSRRALRPARTRLATVKIHSQSFELTHMLNFSSCVHSLYLL